MARVRVVLVRPETSANVGACARLVRNTAAAGLDLVAPGDFRTVECWRTAWGAHDVLEAVRVHDELAPALAGASLAIAFTGRRRRADGPAPVDVREAAALVAGLEEGAQAALVFGPETSGLTNDELTLCGRAATIPADPQQPSYNLSHAVAIAAYEVLRAGRRGARSSRALATHDQKEALLERLESGLRAISALPAVNTASYLRDWRSLVQRLDLTPDELRLFEHLARKLASR